MPDRLPGRRSVGGALAIVVLGALLLGPVTDASWTGRAVIPGSGMSTGVLDLRVDGHDDLDLSGWGGAGLVPGAVLSEVVTVSNAGSVPLRYDLSSSATDPDGRHLGAALDRTVREVASGACGAVLPATPRLLAPGGSEDLCLRVAVPAGAPAAVANSSTRLTFEVAAADGGWSDTATVLSGPVSTAALTAPTVACTLTAISWDAVAGATAYRLSNATTHASVATVSSSTLTRRLDGILGGLAVQAVYGSSDWVSNPVTCG